MAEVIQTLSTDPHFPGGAAKALACLKAMRLGAVQAVEEGRFNAFLRTLRMRQGPSSSSSSSSSSSATAHGTSFWRSVVEAGITLISQEEGGSGEAATGAEAAAFLAESKGDLARVGGRGGKGGAAAAAAAAAPAKVEEELELE
jgi:hypothetical protein